MGQNGLELAGSKGKIASERERERAGEAAK